MLDLVSSRVVNKLCYAPPHKSNIMSRSVYRICVDFFTCIPATTTVTTQYKLNVSDSSKKSCT